MLRNRGPRQAPTPISLDKWHGVVSKAKMDDYVLRSGFERQSG